MTQNDPNPSPEHYHYPRGQLSATGIELEYMVVDRDTLDVRSIVDQLMHDVTGEYRSDFDPHGHDTIIGWSNELALHVVELKTNEPVASLEGVDLVFAREVESINRSLEARNAMLMPTAMHPWMDPFLEMKLWPHEYNAVYEAFNRIFDCRGHGWANLQSTHINLPFANDDEFGRLHAAIRLVLPLLPALAASSPIHDGRITGYIDSRLEVYRANSRSVPAVSGLIIPEPIFTRRDYENEVLGSVYRALAPFDPDGILRHEWANSRGCIARFDRGSIEIRVIDVQESPAADLAVVALTVAAVRSLIEERWMGLAAQQSTDTESLHSTLLDTIRHGEHARITHPQLLSAFGLCSPTSAAELWRHIASHTIASDAPHAATIARLLRAGTLSTRIIKALGSDTTRPRMLDVYHELGTCLAHGTLFHA